MSAPVGFSLACTLWDVLMCWDRCVRSMWVGMCFLIGACLGQGDVSVGTMYEGF